VNQGDDPETGRTLTRTLKYFLLFLCAALAATAQAPKDNPVGEVRDARSWEMGPFGYWGTGVGDRSSFKFFAAGFQIGKVMTPVLHAGILSGQFELAGNIMPIWQAYTPKAHLQLYDCITEDGTPVPCYLPVGGGTFTGVSLTPVIFRWNFLTRSKRIQPWFQGAGGLIYTTHKYPPDVLVPHGEPGGTSVWNFSPQGGIGVRWFTRPKRSVDLALNAVHISSASLGDRNPGVNASLQIQVGYTWWK
jgi:hypothetical protein